LLTCFFHIFFSIKIIRAAAGPSFIQYATTHAGLGVWDLTNGVKLTIEFVANDYTGALLPQLLVSSNSLYWNNSGSIAVTNPINENNWVNSRHVASSTGVAYADLRNYLLGNYKTFNTYQPVTVVKTSYNDLLNGTVSQASVVVDAQDSYWFVNNLVQNLADFGCETETFIQTYASSFDYFTSSSSSASLVQWSSTSVPPSSVFDWFVALDACYTDKYNSAVNAKSGAQLFLIAIQSCYGSYAYVYQSPTSVYNISLIDVETTANYTYRTPALLRYKYKLPTASSVNPETLSWLDYILIILLFGSVSVFVGYVIYILWVDKSKLQTLTMRRRHMDDMDVMPLGASDHTEEEVPTRNRVSASFATWRTSFAVDTSWLNGLTERASAAFRASSVESDTGVRQASMAPRSSFRYLK